MAITKNGKRVRKIFYKGKRVRRVYWRNILVFVEGFFTKLLVKMTSTKINGRKTIPNPAWATWETERQRLAGIVADKQSAYNSAAAAAKPYEDAYNSAVRSRDSWLSSHPEPPKERITQAWKDWESDVKRYEGMLVDATNKVNAALDEWNNAKNAYDSRVNEVNAAIDAYNSHHANPPSKTITVETQAWKSWKSTEEQLENAAYAASNKYDSLKSQADSAYRAWQTAISEGQPQSIIDNLERTYNDLAGQVLRAGDEKDAAYAALANHRANEPTRYETIDNPAYDEWVKEDARLKAEADRLSAAWNADEPTYAQRIKDAEAEYDKWKGSYDWIVNKLADLKANEPTKYERNPDHAKWLNDKAPYDSAVSSASSALAPYASAKQNAYNALQSAQSDYNRHYNTQPAKRIEADAVYYKYSFSVKFKDLPTPQDVSNDTLSISVKINNPQTEANRQNAGFIGQSKGDNPAYLSGSLNLKNTSTTLTTTWASMDMRYTTAEITLTSSEGFKKTYKLDIDKELTTDDFMFRYPD